MTWQQTSSVFCVCYFEISCNGAVIPAPQTVIVVRTLQGDASEKVAEFRVQRLTFIPGISELLQKLPTAVGHIAQTADCHKR